MAIGPIRTSNRGEYPFRCVVGGEGVRMSVERQKIKVAEWLYRWNLSMSILGIVFTILTFVGVFTLVLHTYFLEFGLNEAEVLLVLLGVVLAIIFGFGLYLDKFLRFWSAQTTVATVRNQILTSALYQKEQLIMKYSQVPQMEGLLRLIEELPDSPGRTDVLTPGIAPGYAAGVSPLLFPSWISRTRCAMWDTRASCVTTTIVF